MHEPAQIDEWMLDTEHLLLELDRAREAVLRIPAIADARGPVEAAVDYIWKLRERIRELAVLRGDMQRRWQQQSHPATPADAIPVRAGAQRRNVRR